MGADTDSIRSEHREVCAFLLAGLLNSNATPEEPFVWVDLGCGKASILEHVRNGIPDFLRKSLRYVGVTRSQEDASKAATEAGDMGLCGRSECHCAEFRDLAALAGTICGADLITLTNVAHEVAPDDLADLLCTSVEMLGDTGVLLAYDVQELTEAQVFGFPVSPGSDEWREGYEPEWHALAWDLHAVQLILNTLVSGLGVGALAVVAHWRQRSTTGWTAVVPRSWLTGLVGGVVPGDIRARVHEEVRRQVGEMERRWQERLAAMEQHLAPFRSSDLSISVSAIRAAREDLLRLVRDGCALWYHRDGDTPDWVGDLLAALGRGPDRERR